MMWPRTIELMLGAWLLVSPFVFAGTTAADSYTATTVACGALVVLLSLLAFWEPCRLAHVGTLLVALGLAGHGYFAAARPGPPAAQNELMIGLLLLLFVILPSETNQPPRPWRAPLGRR